METNIKFVARIDKFLENPFVFVDKAGKRNDGFGQGPIGTIWTIGIGLIGLVHSKSNCNWTLMELD